MRLSLEIVMVAVATLITLFVVLTIFQSGIRGVGGITDAKNRCLNIAKVACETTGSPPVTWTTEIVFRDNKNTYTCNDLVKKDWNTLCTPVDNDPTKGYEFNP